MADEKATKGLPIPVATASTMTEAITIEKNSTLAAYEVERLTDLFEKMAGKLKWGEGEGLE
ncbi:hypothetical protein FRC06_007433 [Ceratobasidium sp. 370]|nr:hypothetical protein FRC06_007433 [Ceratobasidium sp. 370]